MTDFHRDRLGETLKGDIAAGCGYDRVRFSSLSSTLKGDIAAGCGYDQSSARPSRGQLLKGDIAAGCGYDIVVSMIAASKPSKETSQPVAVMTLAQSIEPPHTQRRYRSRLRL